MPSLSRTLATMYAARPMARSVEEYNRLADEWNRDVLAAHPNLPRIERLPPGSLIPPLSFLFNEVQAADLHFYNRLSKNLYESLFGRHHGTILDRLANVVHWTCTTFAVLLTVLGFSILLLAHQGAAGRLIAAAACITALLLWLAGRAVRYILSGPRWLR